MDAISLLTGLGVLAAFNERAIEYLFGQWEHPSLNKLLPYVSMLLGIGEGVGFHLNALPLVGINENAMFGYIVTGVVLGAGSNFLHSVFGQPVQPEEE